MTARAANVDRFGTAVILAGRIVKRSRSLRGMLEYARVSDVMKVETRKRAEHDADPAGVMLVTYRDGATCEAVFNSHAIMIDWIRARRSWRHSATYSHADGEMGYLTRPGIIAGPGDAAPALATITLRHEPAKDTPGKLDVHGVTSGGTVCRWPWWMHSKPTRRNRFVMVNCARHAVTWCTS